MAYTQIETLANCHLIFKVDGIEERYSSVLSHARNTPFLSVSAVLDHISPGNLILTFRTPYVIAPAISPRIPSLPFLPRPLLFLYTLFIVYLLRINVNYAQNVTREFSAKIIFAESNSISCISPIKFSIQFLIYYIFTFLRPAPESFELRKNRALTSRFVFSGDKDKTSLIIKFGISQEVPFSPSLLLAQ